MKRTRVAVIGCGVMGSHHASNYASMPQASLVAVVDPDPQRLHEAMVKYGCRGYPSVADLLANEEISAASVATPTSTHFAVTSALLAGGVHVMVEKPLAPTLEQAQELVELSRQTGLVLQVGHITRFYEAVRLLNGTVRKPYLIEARRQTPHTRIRDVGVVLDLMIHDIDIILRLVPHPIADLSVAGHAVEGSDLEDMAVAQVVFENGCIARLLASRASYANERNLTVVERSQTVTVDFSRDPHTEVSIHRTGRDGAGSVKVDRHEIQEDNPLRRELSHFLDRINFQASPIGTAEDDLRSLAVASEVLARMKLTQIEELQAAFD